MEIKHGNYLYGYIGAHTINNIMLYVKKRPKGPKDVEGCRSRPRSFDSSRRWSTHPQNAVTSSASKEFLFNVHKNKHKIDDVPPHHAKMASKMSKDVDLK